MALVLRQDHFCSFKHHAQVEPCKILISLALDVIRRFILLFAWDMPMDMRTIGFVGTAANQDVSIDVRDGCTCSTDRAI
jgi:hypothetical protein